MPNETKLADFDNEFAVTSTNTATATSNETQTETQVTQIAESAVGQFSREIDLGDGSGKQVFSADSLEGLVDKLTEAQTHATRKIREQSAKLRVKAQPALEPNGVKVDSEFTPKSLTLDEKFALSQQLQSDPDGAFEAILQANGLSTADLRSLKSFVATQQAQTARNTIDTEFLQDHADDFHPSPANATAITNFLKSENLPYSKQNLDFAFQELSESGLLEAKPDASNVVNDGEENKQGIPVKAHTRTKPLSTGVRSTVSSQRTAAEITGPEKQVEVDVAKIYSESDPDKARQMMLALMQKAKSSSR